MSEFDDYLKDEVTLTGADLKKCDGAITGITLTGSVNVNYETLKVSIGGDVPNGITWMQFFKFLHQKVYWLRQGMRNHMMGKNANIGTALRAAGKGGQQ